MPKTFRKLKLQELNRLSGEEYKKAEKIPVVAILENIRSLHNIGSVFRSADAFRLSEIWLCGFSACPPHREINKTALGAQDNVDWKYFKAPQDVIDYALKNDISLIAVEQCENSISPEIFIPKSENHIALIFGNEVEGVSDELITASEFVIEIPQSGSKHSLNISVCAGIIFWEMFNKYKDRISK